ncbi:MAG: cell division protein FtsA [Angelakisella sp.]|jgi:cell division ATPase FtsA|nr:cell division protein FtsA [Angelakisella sp.]
MRSKGGAKGKPPKKAGDQKPRQPRQKTPQGKDILFILDIGTRSVIGVAGRVRDEMLEVLCVESAEHSQRAVVDGQIEDIEQTAKIAGLVKDRMEQKLNISFQEVHVAAAGRVLKTGRVSCEMELDDQKSIGAKELAALESMGVQRAYQDLIANLSEGDPIDFCSVGHTIVGYQLDGYSFSTLTGHRGKLAGIDLIATFLPSEVVESLYTTMSMLGLTIASMTLEPIAAMNAVVPRELRLLNIALVDVGAGTSDIAVADKGSVCGYTMATVAGDEITERLMQEYLIDFETAERMKFAASAGEPSFEYADVLGFPYTVSREEILERIRPTVEDLAEQIARGILSVNNDPPKAVFMVGGGSRTPELCQRVAAALGIEENKVAIGGNNYMKRQITAEAQYLSAEYATPIGIAVTAMATGGGENFSVTLNGSRLQLLGKAMTVMEALRRGGFQYGQIMGRSGKSVVLEYNGARRIVRGGLPTLAEIRVNGELAGLSTLLQAGDQIAFLPASDGEDAAPTIQSLADPWAPFEVELFGQITEAGTRAWLNGIPADGDQLVVQGDQVQVKQIDTLGELLRSMGFSGWEEGLVINGKPADTPDQKLAPGDVISLGLDTPAPKAEIPPPPPKPVPDRPQPERPALGVVLNGQPYSLPPKEDGSWYQLFDLLNFVDIDPSNPKGEIVVTRNGVTASYLEPLQNGDQVDIHWAEER